MNSEKIWGPTVRDFPVTSVIETRNCRVSLATDRRYKSW